MTAKTSTIDILREYFIEKGQLMTYEEYKSQDDTPIRPLLIKRIVGNWGRVLNLVGDLPKKEEKQPELPLKEPKK